MKPGKRKIITSVKRRRRSSSDAETNTGSSQVKSVEDTLWAFLEANKEQIASKLLSSTRWTDMMENTNELETQITELRVENEELRKRLSIAEGRLTRSEGMIDNLSEKTTDLTSRSMRDNVIIKNMEEEEHEDVGRLEEKLFKFFASEMNLGPNELGKIHVERIHRIGKQSNDRQRHIVVKLNSKGKSIVMANIKYLRKESKIKITEQFPPEIHAQCDKLWPMFVEAKQQGKQTRWNQDKLLIDGRSIKPPTDKIMDINMDVTLTAAKLQPKHTAVVTREGSHFQGHIVHITSKDEVVPAIKALCADTRVAGASHVMYAYRVGTERYSIHNWEDDGEWGGARWIMEAISNKNVYNRLVCVTRWYGGKHMGRARFETIKDMAITAIEDHGGV